MSLRTSQLGEILETLETQAHMLRADFDTFKDRLPEHLKIFGIMLSVQLGYSAYLLAEMRKIVDPPFG
jgi:hypothetical protein